MNWNQRKLKEIEEHMEQLITDINMEKATPRLVYDGGDNFDENWLQHLNVGAIFTCRDIKGRGNPILEFEIVVKYPNGDVMLLSDLNEPHVSIIVPSLEFSRSCEMRSLSYVGEED